MQQDLLCIRELCRRVRDIANSEENAQKRQRWALHNELQGDEKPLFWICPDEDGGWLELVPPTVLQTKTPLLQKLEMQLRKLIYQYENLDDDFVIEPTVRFDIPGEYTGYLYGSATQTSAWGINIQPLAVSQNAYHMQNYLDDKDNLARLLAHEVDFIPDEEEWSRIRQELEEAVDGIVRVQFTIPYCALVQSLLIDLIHLRGMSELMMDFYDNPEMLHAILGHMSRSKARLLTKLEERKLLFDNRTNIYTGSGGLGYTSAAAKPDGEVKITDLWGFADAQELSEVSPAMFKEYAVEYQKEGLSRFGMACYGCCEPLDNKFEMIFEALPNLRRLSVSPWSNITLAAEKIEDKAIYSWKPNPAKVCMGFDRAGIEADLSQLKAATGGRCHTEIILKDIRTCGGKDSLQQFAALVRKQWA